MAERPAVNASPLIYLAGADLLSFLQLAGPEIVVPRPVAEIRAGGSVDAAARALESTPWLTVVEVPSVPAHGLVSGTAKVGIQPRCAGEVRDPPPGTSRTRTTHRKLAQALFLTDTALLETLVIPSPCK